MPPRPGVPPRGHYRPIEPRTRVPRRGHCRPKCPLRLATGWHRRLFPFFGRRLSGFSRLAANERRRPEVRNKWLDWHRAPEAWCSRTGTLLPRIPTWLLTLLSNTPQTKCDCSGTLILFSAVVPFVGCHGRREILLRRAVHDCRNHQAFPRPPKRGAHHAVA